MRLEGFDLNPALKRDQNALAQDCGISLPFPQ